MSHRCSLLNYILLLCLPLVLWFESGVTSYAYTLTDGHFVYSNTSSAFVHPSVSSITFNNEVSSSGGTISGRVEFPEYNVVGVAEAYSTSTGFDIYYPADPGTGTKLELIPKGFDTSGHGWLSPVNLSLSNFKVSNSGVSFSFDIPIYVGYRSGFYRYSNFYDIANGSAFYPDNSSSYSFVFSTSSSILDSNPYVISSYYGINYYGVDYVGAVNFVEMFFSNTASISFYPYIHVDLYLPPDTSTTLSFRSLPTVDNYLYEIPLPDGRTYNYANSEFSGDGDALSSSGSSMTQAEDALFDSASTGVSNFNFTSPNAIVGFGSTALWVSNFMQDIYTKSPFSPAFNILISVGLASMAIGLVKFWKGG